MTIKKNLIAILVIAIGLSFKFTIANAQDGDISKWIPDPSEVVSTVIVISPPGLMTRAPLTAKQLLGFGCNSTTDSKNIFNLIDIIKNNVQNEKNEAGQFYLRNVIYLNLKNGSTIRYLFSDANNRNNEIYGGAENGGIGSYIPFLAQSGFLVDLRKWLLNDSVMQQSGKWCVENQ